MGTQKEGFPCGDDVAYKRDAITAELQYRPEGEEPQPWQTWPDLIKGEVIIANVDESSEIPILLTPMFKCDEDERLNHYQTRLRQNPFHIPLSDHNKVEARHVVIELIRHPSNYSTETRPKRNYNHAYLPFRGFISKFLRSSK